MENNKNYLLCQRKIYDILIGDTLLGEDIIEGNIIEKNQLPYLSGPTICKVAKEFFGYSIEYSKYSRWEYIENILKIMIEEDKLNIFFNYIFSKQNFENLLLRTNSLNIYEKICVNAINKINLILSIGGNKLFSVSGRYYVDSEQDKILISTKAIKNLDHLYIKSIIERAYDDIENNNFDSAITKSRTLLEEIFCYVIEINNEIPEESGEIKKLYNQVKKLYSMHQDKNTDIRINMLLSGLEKIITSISEMRNKSSDSHGVGQKRINLSNYHARLYVNAANILADFILSVHLNKIKN
nr:abortive infection family protein [Fusobacterium nucleatum]